MALFALPEEEPVIAYLASRLLLFGRLLFVLYLSGALEHLSFYSCFALRASELVTADRSSHSTRSGTAVFSVSVSER